MRAFRSPCPGPKGRGNPGRLVMAGFIPAVLLLAAAAACTSPRPGSPAAAVTAPRVRHLAAPIVLEAVTSRHRSPPPPPSTARGSCPAGFAALPGPGADPDLCYHQLGRPMTITYAAIALIPPQTPPMSYGLAISLRRGDRARLQAITTQAAGHQVAFIVAGRAWAIPYVPAGPLTHGQFEILVPTRQQASDLLRILGQPG